MNIKRIIVSSLILVTVAAAVAILGFNESERENEPDEERFGESVLAGLDVITVETSTEQVRIDFNGRARAQQRIELFSEMPGKLIHPDRPFEAGRWFREGEVLVRVEDTEARLELQSLRSGFRNLVSSLMPDLNLDYPEVAGRFEEFLASIDPQQSIPELPVVEDRQLYAFLSSRDLFNNYYRVRSAENRLEKFEIKAPFDGVLISALADEGYRISPQTHLGTFISDSGYEMVTTLSQKETAFLSPGDKLLLRDQSNSREWTGTVDRINRSIDARSQGVRVYLQVGGSDLIDGLYLEGSIHTDDTMERAVIPRSALLRSGHVYRIKDGIVSMEPVKVMGVKGIQIYVSGLSDGDRIIANPDRPFAGTRVSNQGGS